MRITKEVLSTSVFVRRVAVGTAPFRWEVHGVDRAEPLHVSADRYASMETAYLAGQARLADFVPKRATPVDVASNRRWRTNSVACEDVSV